MKKIVVLGNALGLFASVGVILKYMYMLVIYPFISKQTTSMTIFGIFVLVLAIGTFAVNYDYFKERLK
mgnify:CR=1 FL=1